MAQSKETLVIVVKQLHGLFFASPYPCYLSAAQVRLFIHCFCQFAHFLSTSLRYFLKQGQNLFGRKRISVSKYFPLHKILLAGEIDDLVFCQSLFFIFHICFIDEKLFKIKIQFVPQAFEKASSEKR